ncbi:MAG: protein kinase [Phycisphaerales bacterium]|nr:MAG: protein kinase [Phycisphaerales bacterium]
MTACFSQDLVERYVSGRCSEDEARVVDAHLCECDRCRRRVQSGRPTLAGPEEGGGWEHGVAAGVGGSGRVGSGDGESATLPAGRRRKSGGEGVSDITFAGYQILDELPRGGQAVVYKAVQKATKMKVALKVLPPGLSASPRARHYFRREVELAASLNHPNIVAIHDSGIVYGQYYFSMEYIHGMSLDEHLRAHTLSLRNKIILFGKICDAMTHAHQRGVIHRDLKPSNILVDERGEPHIVDFGLAKSAGSLNAVSETTLMPSMTGQIKGTAAYMSPEQAAGRSDLVDVRTDVYSLGIILYRMCTGKFPYDVSGSDVRILDNIQHVEPVRPRQIISRFNSDLEAIMLRALEKDPADRYQSAAQLWHDVRCWLDGLPIVARSVSSLYLLRKVISRHRYTTTVVLLLVLIVLGFSGTYYHLYRQLRASGARLELANTSLDNQTREFAMVAPQVIFVSYFLPAWHGGDDKEAAFVGRYFTEGSREAYAAAFLLEERPMYEKAARFKGRMKEADSSFSEFVIAEHHLKNGDLTEAVDAYRRCLARGRGDESDLWLMDKARSRLYELAVVGGRGRSTTAND